MHGPSQPVKFTSTRNTFTNSTGAAITYAFDGCTAKKTAAISRDTFINANPVNSTVCVRTFANETVLPQLSLSGTTGLDPLKPSGNASAPW